MKLTSFSPRLLVIVIVGTVMTLAAFGWGFWFLSAAQYRRVVDGWIDAGRAAGYQISFDHRQVFGFPRRITMRLINLHWKNADGIDFHTDDMDIAVTPWNWNVFDVKFKNHVSVAAPLDNDGHALMLACSDGQAHVRLDSDGYWREATLFLEDAKFGLAPHYIFEANKVRTSVVRPETGPKNHTEAGLTLEGEATGILIPSAMPSPFGAKAAKLSVHMRVMGALPDIREKAQVDAWNKDSGIVEFDGFAVDWGVLNLESKGTLGFDDDLQPEGAFVGTVSHPEETVHTLIDRGFIAMHDQTMLASLTESFSNPLPHGSKGLELPITVQLGGLYLGPVHIFTFPEIIWPTEAPKPN